MSKQPRDQRDQYELIVTHSAEELELAGYDSARIAADWGGRVMPADEGDQYQR